LDVAPDDIPHYYEILWADGQTTTPAVHRLTNEFLLPNHGVIFVETPLEATYEQLRTYLKHYYKDMYVVVGCNSKNGGHSVVMKNDDYLWDPAQDNSGCVGPMDDGYYWIGLLLTSKLCAESSTPKD
jgi:hypothetical protein